MFSFKSDDNFQKISNKCKKYIYKNVKVNNDKYSKEITNNLKVQNYIHARILINCKLKVSPSYFYI